jgi:hypothetical protein
MLLDQLKVESKKIKAPFKGVTNGLLSIPRITGKVGEVIATANTPPQRK